MDLYFFFTIGSHTHIMSKPYPAWSIKKERADNLEERPNFQNREIWLAATGINIGFEEDGKGENFLRPVVIFRKFNRAIFWALPLTSTLKDSPFNYVFSFNEDGSKSSVLLSQIKLMDAKRLFNKIGTVNKVDFEQIKEKLKALMP